MRTLLTLCLLIFSACDEDKQAQEQDPGGKLDQTEFQNN